MRDVTCPVTTVKPMIGSMRRSASAVLFVLALSASLAGCKKKPAAKPAVEDAGVASRPARDRSPAFQRFEDRIDDRQTGFEPVTAEELEPIVPTLANSVPTGNPMRTSRGRRVNIVHCHDGSDLDKLRADLEVKMRELGWDNIKPRKPREGKIGHKELLKLVAEKPPYRVTAIVHRGNFRNCRESEGKVKVVMAFFKRPGGGQNAPGSDEEPL